jgi:type II secretory pathway component PulM
MRGQPTRPRKSGTILAVALILLTVVMLLGGVLAKRMLIYHQQTRLDELRQQASWLAESGCQRALRATMASADYSGETWRIPSEVLADGSTGSVVIRVERQPASATGRRVIVTATYPVESTRANMVQREVIVKN